MNYEELKTIPLAEYCIKTLGYTIDREHDCKRWRVLRSPSNTKILTKSEPNKDGHYVYKTYNDTHKGSLVDLLMHEHGYDWQKIRSLIPGIHLLPPEVTTPKEQEPPRVYNINLAPMHERPTPFSAMNRDNYLTKRSISYDTLKAFDIGAMQYSTVFPLWNLESNGTFKVTAAIKYYMMNGESLKKVLGTKGSAVSILRPKKKNNIFNRTVYFFESPIDALSYYQLLTPNVGDDNIYVSICGNPSVKFQKRINEYLQRLRAVHVIFAFDNSKSGQKYTDLFIDLIQGDHTKESHSNLLGEHKDFNDYLMYWKEQNNPKN